MTIENLEKALLNRFVTGEVHLREGPITWKEINAWEPENRAWQVANMLLQVFIHPEDAPVIPESVNEVLQMLQEGGWDGKTLHDFHKDSRDLMLSLKGRLSEKDWGIFFKGSIKRFLKQSGSDTTQT
ncbi:hypothetical protein A3A79_03745 [Candidatus Gottesmanbacteria bacterium RIFCSPLOWO2_01_FULL_43_11b]|uniref:Uncharacterized protein n=1 Tax=Candidatus Gottesmanbacteria bacterium RIFCSPLOWO2_01_FULL_43_11b TaxID=1798392 RepID=A0A1F6AIM4_9BACT|nr:MAG: hypothetical protein A3A79_03745 [Candidatus Gottesmanbacteria bacterium RIFCSPLOWO2_01_FULL_43_11b]